MTQGLIKHTLLIFVCILSLLMIYSAMLKLVGFPGMEESFAIWNYPKWFMVAVGIYEMIIGIIIFVPKTRLFGLIGALILMAGALYTHLYNGEYNQLTTALFVIVLSTSSIVLMWFLEKDQKEKR